MRALVLLVVIAACRDAGPFDRGQMTAIVDAVRPRVTQPHKRYDFKLAPSLDPATLGPAPAMLGRGDGRGLVRAEMDDADHLSVSIETVDEGHAGESGFMYTDPGFAHADVEDVQHDSQHETRIDDRWLRWTYDLD